MKFGKLETDSARNGTVNGDIKDTGPAERDPDTQCGIGSFRPAYLQCFARIGAFIGIYSISGLLTSTLSVYINSQVSMLEKQFGFSSAETGLLMSCNDIGYLTCIIFAGYIARKVHIPRGLGFSTVLYGICGIMCALPYFIQDRSSYAVGGKSGTSSAVNANFSSAMSRGRKVPMCVNESMLPDDGCNSALNSQQMSANIQELHIKKLAYCLIAFGMVFQGVGKSVRYPFVTLYIDDAVDKRKTGFYMGIITGTGIFGPALAYLLGGVFSKIYITLEAVQITPSDPRWIGAWWLGFLVFGACSIFFSVPIMCFPRNLKSKSRMKDLEMLKKEENIKNKTATKTVVHELKEFASMANRVLRNPVYLLLVSSSCVNIIGVGGVMSFMPKYLAAQYSIPLWQANIILALSSITAVALGSFLGGVMSRRIEMTPLTTVKILLLFYLINIACIFSGFFLGCDQPTLVGDSGKSEISTLYQNVELPCLQDCTCNDEKYFPICGDDGRSYFSPCHAGCTVQSLTEFSNCTCITSGQAVAGLCDQGCSTKLYTYAVITFVGKLFTAFKIIPSFLAQIRCVDESDRAAASAFSGFLASALGWMPAPVIFGAIIDGTCLLWKYTCDERQSCYLYDIVFFRNAIHGYSIVATSLATLIVCLLYGYFRVKGITQWRSSERKAHLEKSINIDHELKKPDSNHVYTSIEKQKD